MYRIACLFPFLTACSLISAVVPESRTGPLQCPFETDKQKQQARIEAGGWQVAWGREITPIDLIAGVVAAGISVYSLNPDSFTTWVKELARDSLSRLGTSLQELQPEVRESALRFARERLEGLIKERAPGATEEAFGRFRWKVGVATYSLQNRVYNPFSGSCERIGPTLPSWQPYVAVRFTDSSSPGDRSLASALPRPDTTL